MVWQYRSLSSLSIAIHFECQWLQMRQRLAIQRSCFVILATPQARPLYDTACMLFPLRLHLRILLMLRQDRLQVVLDVSHGRPIGRIVLPHPLEELHHFGSPFLADGKRRRSVNDNVRIGRADDPPSTHLSFFVPTASMIQNWFRSIQGYSFFSDAHPLSISQ